MKGKRKEKYGGRGWKGMREKREEGPSRVEKKNSQHLLLHREASV